MTSPWERYGPCRKCGVEAHEPCLNARRGGRPTTRAHPGRRRVKVPYVAPRDRGGYTEHGKFFSMLSRMVEAAGKRVRHADVADLAALVAIQDDLEAAIRDGIAGLREDGYSWKSIGEGLTPPVSGQAVYMRYGKPKAEKAS